MKLDKWTVIWCVLSPDRGEIIRGFKSSEACREYCDKLNRKAGFSAGHHPMAPVYKCYAKISGVPLARINDLKDHKRNGADDLATFIARIKARM